MKLKNKTFNTDNPPMQTVGLISIASIFYEAFFEFITLFLLLYVQLASPLIQASAEQYKLMLLVITLGLVACKLFVGFGYTVVGYFIDKRDYPLGRYRTFILFGSTLTTFFFVLLFFVCPLFEGWLYVVLFLVLYLLTYLSYSINDVAFFSYLNTFSTDEKKKGMYSSLINGFGVLGAYITAALSPTITGGDAKRNLTIFALVLVVLFFVSQFIFAVFMREREETKIKIKNTDTALSPIKLLFKDKQILLTMFVFLLIFVAQDLVIGNSTNYFYFEYGYGSFSSFGIDGTGNSGAFVSFFFTIAFGVGNTLSGFIYPLISKKLNKKKILIIFGILISLVYILLYFFGFRKGNELSLYFLSFSLSFVHGIVYTPLYVNCFEMREYYYAKTGEDKNGSIQGVRGAIPSVANAIQVALFYVFLNGSNLMSTNELISSFEACSASNDVCETLSTLNSNISESANILSKNIYLSSMTFLPLALTILAIVLTISLVKVNDERNYVKYVETILEAKRKNI